MMLGNILLFAVIVVVVLIMRKGGGCCGGHNHGVNSNHCDHESPPGNHDDTGHAHHQRQIETSIDNEDDTDPVCGMNVREQKIASSHHGRTFHFCSEQCRKIFDLNPNKFSGA